MLHRTSCITLVLMVWWYDGSRVCHLFLHLVALHLGMQRLFFPFVELGRPDARWRSSVETLSILCSLHSTAFVELSSPSRYRRLQYRQQS